MTNITHIGIADKKNTERGEFAKIVLKNNKNKLNPV